MVEVKRAHIHHRDGNPLNNPPDGSNWQVLCPTCHRKTIKGKKYQHNGIHIVAYLAEWKREEILKDRNYRCENCGVEVGLRIYPKKRKQRCAWCNRVIPKKAQRRWPDGSIVCRQCVDEYFDNLIKETRDKEPVPDI